MPGENKAVPGLEEFNLDDFQTDHDKMKTDATELRGLHVALKEEVTKFRAESISKEEFETRLSKISGSLDGISERMERAENLTQTLGSRFQYDDYRSMLTGLEWLRHEDGRPYNEIDYRAHALFQMPINYDKHEHGQDLLNLRNMHDAVICVDTWKRSLNQSSHYRIEELPLFKRFAEEVKRFDPKLAHAMGTSNTGYGAEFVPQQMSAAFNELLRIEPSLANNFQKWQMPIGSSAYYPFQNGRAVVYRGSEALVDNAVQARKTNIATDRYLFTPIMFIGALLGSEEVTEDSIVAMIDFIRRELSTAILEALDSALCNGDTTSPHMDNDAGTKYASYQIETGFKGVRRLAVDATKTVNIETTAGDTGPLVLTIGNFLELQGMMGTAGTKVNRNIWLTGVKGRGQIQNALFNEDALGVLQYIITGNLPTILGSPVKISEQYNEDQDSDGFTATIDAGKHTSVCGIHTDSYRIGQRRGITLEMGKDLMTQQRQFVATARFDFGPVHAASVTPVVCGINCQHSA